MEDEARGTGGRILRWRGTLDRLVASHREVERACAEVARLEAELPSTVRGFGDIDKLHAFTEDYESRLGELDDARRALVEVEAEHRTASAACDFVPEGATLVHPYGAEVYQIKRLKAASAAEAARDDAGAPSRSTEAPNFKITSKGPAKAAGGAGDGVAPAAARASGEEAFGPPQRTIRERLSAGRLERGPGRRRRRRRSLETASAEDEGTGGGAGGETGQGPPGGGWPPSGRRPSP